MKTAVEWLLDWMKSNQYFIGNDLLQAVEQAEEMRMEEIVNEREEAYSNGYANGQKDAYTQ